MTAGQSGPDDAVRALSIAGEGTDCGILLIHGITGSPASLRPLAADVAQRTGAAAEVPLLAGHGTRWQELSRARWEDWTADVDAAFDDLSGRCARVVVVGLSMGGALALDLAQRRPGVAALVLVNPALYIDSPLAPVLPVLGRVVRSVPAIGDDIARPGVTERAYPRTPLRAIARFHRALPGVRARLWEVRNPVTLCLSGADAVVGPRSARTLRRRLPAPPRIIALRRSRHVATLDYDTPLIADAIAAHVGPQPGGGAPA
ncbi:alpha/beta fold hydrolase [Brevibacterium sp. 5221]|uniref:Alpha/beta fold hydrolase n=1 Tax=Brevibacterium rongguiense TaxID=2695267 RepID=A0A6N9H865_9MICO|nr:MULTISPECIES: alpha/beta fold hydrolase [Brevibacterium]MYM20248.1 alpha/beta fold hydrolase [Brevibacterium rongguiense]WAL40749.1 alpha/beta fold hydrolase [Brevibacterium sp. BRM-1]